MDYKEKYEQAIENLRKIKVANKDNKELVDFIEYKYPELKESEDEKIKKSLIGHLKECRNNTRSEVMIGEYAKWIAWLEKVIIPSHNDIDLSFIEDIKNVITEAPLLIYSDKEKMIAWLEKQGEQKPINQCNTQEPTLDEAKKWNEAYEKGYSLGYENGRNEQKPAEWSEENEIMKVHTLQIIKKYWNSLPDTDYDDENEMSESCYNWLKSLKSQSHWKPSEEQMNYLKKVYESYSVCEGERWALESLYNDLSKL